MVVISIGLLNENLLHLPMWNVQDYDNDQVYTNVNESPEQMLLKRQKMARMHFE